MKIIEVNSKETIKAFHKLPYSIYIDDKNWIPHIKQDVEKVFDPQQNKAHSKGKIIRWILEDENKNTIGRIAAFISNINSDNKTAGIGFFECINNQQSANTLLNTAKKWLSNYDVTSMDGPINFGEKNMFWGLLIENFIDPNSYGMNYNPPYYQDLFETYGFKMYYKSP